MGKVSRRIVADGWCYQVACAVRSDGVTSPVAEFLDRLADGLVDQDAAPDLEPDEQIRHLDWLEAAFKWLAEEGELPGMRSYNQLRDGIWEVKRFNLRITFYDTDGLGHYVKKIDFDGGGFWGKPPRFPEFDPFIRLTTAFVKAPETRWTPLSELAFAEAVRDEDVAHDRVRY